MYSAGLVFVTGSVFSVFSGSGIVNFGFLNTGVTLLLEGSCCCWFLSSFVLAVVFLVSGLLVFGCSFKVGCLSTGLCSTEGGVSLCLGLVPISWLYSRLV